MAVLDRRAGQDPGPEVETALADGLVAVQDRVPLVIDGSRPRRGKDAGGQDASEGKNA